MKKIEPARSAAGARYIPAATSNPSRMTMKPIQLFDTASSTYTYLLFDPTSREAIIIDPVDTQVARGPRGPARLRSELVWALETHTHADHITSAGQLAELAGAKTTAPAACGASSASGPLKDGDVLNFGAEQIRALHTPAIRRAACVFSGVTMCLPATPC